MLGRKTLNVPDKQNPGKFRKMNFDRELIYMVDEFQVAVTTALGAG